MLYHYLRMLGTMYQELGDYKRALAHLKQAKKLLHTKMESDLQHLHAIGVGFVREIDGEKIILSTDWWSDYDIYRNIKAIEAGTPLVGPRAKKASITSESVSPDPLPSAHN